MRGEREKWDYCTFLSKKVPSGFQEGTGLQLSIVWYVVKSRESQLWLSFHFCTLYNIHHSLKIVVHKVVNTWGLEIFPSFKGGGILKNSGFYGGNNPPENTTS